MPDPETPLLDKIAAGETLDGSDELCQAMREIADEAAKWVGRHLTLECDGRGWLIRYTSGNSYRDQIVDRYGYSFACAEDAIASLVALAARNKAEVEREEAANVG